MKILSSNRKAYHNFFIFDTFEAGISLLGSEVKAVRKHGMGIDDSFVIITDGEVLIKNAYVKRYDQTTNFAAEERRSRKLLLHKEEIERLLRKVKVKSFTIVPLKVYLKGSFIKLEIGLAKGKKLFDKRNSLKEESQKREVERAQKKS